MGISAKESGKGARRDPEISALTIYVFLVGDDRKALNCRTLAGWASGVCSRSRDSLSRCDTTVPSAVLRRREHLLSSTLVPSLLSLIKYEIWETRDVLRHKRRDVTDKEKNYVPDKKDVS